MHMGTFGKSVIETFKDAQLKILQIFCDYTDKVKFFQYFMTRLMKKINMNFSFFFVSSLLIFIIPHLINF